MFGPREWRGTWVPGLRPTNWRWGESQKNWSRSSAPGSTSITILTAPSLRSRAADDAKTIDGTWVVASAELAGDPFPDEIRKGIKLTLEGGNYTAILGAQPDKGTVKVDSSTNPKSLEIIGTDAPNKGRTIHAIYEVTEGNLKICYDLSGTSKPTEFKTAQGTKLLLANYVRENHKTTKPLPRATPESQGISSQAILDYIQATDNINSVHSATVLRHGKIIAETWWKPEAADKPHVLWSLSKSFNATAVGLAIADGKLSLDDPVLKFFPDDAPADPSENLTTMKVRDLLPMSCGHDAEPKISAAGPSVKQFLSIPVPFKPGH